MITFKDDVDPRDFRFFTRNCEILFVAAMRYCQDKDLPFRITSLKSDRGNVISKSSTHEEGRAFDLSVKQWEALEIGEFVKHFNKQYSNIGAISASDLKPRACVFHDSGYGAHLHMQARRDGIRA